MKTSFGTKTIEILGSFFPLCKRRQRRNQNVPVQAPRRFTALLKKHIANLKDNPYMYPEYPGNPNYRRMLVGNYIVFYKINDAEKQIDIYRILRASWDLPKYL